MENIFTITPCISIMPRPQGGEQLAGAITHLAETGYTVLVSLVTDEEIALLGLEGEEEECAASNIRYIHFPVNDFGVPANTHAALSLIEELSAAIHAGHKIIIHCRGGIGRSSLIAGALLMRGGFTHAEAIALIAERRGCKVPETAEQDAWLMGLKGPQKAGKHV